MLLVEIFDFEGNKIFLHSGFEGQEANKTLEFLNQGLIKSAPFHSITKKKDKIKDAIFEKLEILEPDAILVLNNVDMNFSCTKNIEVQSNTGNLEVFGLDNDQLEIIKKVSTFYEGKEKTKVIPMIYRHQDSEYELPELAFGSKPSRIDDDFLKVKEVSWACVNVYYNRDLIYHGDIIDFQVSLDSISFELGTHHYFKNFPVFSFLHREDREDLFIRFSRQELENMFRERIPMAFTRNHNAYYKFIKEEFIQSHIDEMFGLNEIFNYSIIAEESWFQNDWWKKQIEAYEKEFPGVDKDVGTAEPYDPKNREKKKKASADSYRYIEGFIDNVIEEFSEKGRFLCWSDDFEFYFSPYNMTVNSKPIIIAQDDKISIVSEFIHKDDRFVFETTILNFKPGHAYYTNGHEIYVDSVSMSCGTKETFSAIVDGFVNSDIKKKFLWR